MLFRKLRLKNWLPLKQTKTKNKRHFFMPTFKVIQLCFFVQNHIFTLKVLKLHFVSIKNGSASISNAVHWMFNIKAEPRLTETNCVFRTFRVKISFWTKKQSCTTLKVGNKKWCLFFVFVCFSGCQSFTLSLRKRLNVFENSGP